MADRTSLIRTRRASGQAAMEFVVALVWIIALTALIYQALHFELDVFNKLGELRYRVFRMARQNQDSTKGRMISEAVEGKQLGEIVPYTVPGQYVDSTLRYGPKNFYIHCGTRKWFPGGDGVETTLKGAIIAGLVTDHAKVVPEWMGTALGEVHSVLGEIPCN
ncbi:MAG: hypothetical protein ACYC7A_06870 [Thermoanaerobaculia bacterium]